MTDTEREVLNFDSTKRFSNRVENYLKYRPRYPSEIIPFLEKECGLTADSKIADVGSGTGFLTEPFLCHGNVVVGIEPNAEMRAAGDQLLAKYANFSSIDGTAEKTTLPDGSVDFVTVGQAFHWFDRPRARTEFARILKPGGWIVLVWNGYDPERTPLIAGYHDVLLRYGTDYREVRREIEGTQVAEFFQPGVCQLVEFKFQQLFDFDGLKGRMLSASYAPQPGEANYEPMIAALQEVFDANERDGQVVFDYDTEVYYGQFS